ncbi:PEPxxWA-CTERM sorting domain-containing protein [Microvirga sp. SRT01]|uniref:PEPxxWA-CTERM sorting domain-containing protein n=1 Tax=Sphingomonas longa TaxID=2778730 RepID=A0ABS2DAC3_9SPHN|nr:MULTISPECIES: PEPxxWA-CTERM sorting domain-containing protein [Alphaproteobacteria]MBM6577877.1 PEPxxWA-CTERM sorting domain-containing protein [Sphingomonas sp. BT552]MBR7710918.1 PEPxxWA-CTERM sorting domain-containing protein [Microvirga sp. SRT01]
MKKLIIAAAAIATIASVPAAARTYSLAGDFGNPVFQYGTVTNGGAGNTFTTFAPSDCSDINVSTLCYRGTDKFQVLFQRDAANVLVHPGPEDGQNSFLMFVAPRTGTYTYDVTVNRGDSGDGVNLFTFNSLDGTKPLIATINAGNPTYTFQYSQFLTAGQKVGLGIDRGGPNNSYFNDSTTFSGTISGAVPEPATWAMMIGGIGMVGGAMRRRRVSTKVSFA